MIKILFALFTVFIFTFNGFSQISKRKSYYSKKSSNKVSQTINFIGGGVSAGEMSGLSYYGFNFEYGSRVILIKMGNYMNFSMDVSGQTHIFTIESIYEELNYGSMLTGQIVFNFNALTGAYVPSKKSDSGIPLGIYLGPGLLIEAGPPVRTTSNKMSIADLGPYFNLGFRFKLSKSYFFDLKFFGGFLAINETAEGGVNFLFPIGMGNSGKRKTSRYST